MPLLETKGAASAQGFGMTLQQGPVNYIEDVFSTWLYTSSGTSSQNATISNGINLSTKGSLIWTKSRSNAIDNYLVHRESSSSSPAQLISNSTAAAANDNPYFTYLSTGYRLPTFADSAVGTASGNSGYTYASWTFREQPKFFDVVTYTGNGVLGRTISHNLGSAPGFMIVKCTSSAADWACYHQALGPSYSVLLNSTSAAVNTRDDWVNGSLVPTAPTSTQFTVSDGFGVNGNGQTYVAYLFAHNAGGFGLTGTDNVISCGSFTAGNTTTPTVVNLGFEPQWVLIKRTTGGDPYYVEWRIFDVMRGMPNPSGALALYPNTSSAESSADAKIFPTATGFSVLFDGVNISGNNFIYIAIRRGPMKTPTSGTSVYTAMQNDGVEPGYSTSFTVDSAIQFLRQSGFGISWQKYWGSRLTGTGEILTSSTAAEQANSEFEWDYQNGFSSNTGTNYFAWLFRRAPGFFDEVCYTGTGNVQVLNHNLGVFPQLVIVKSRSASANWPVVYAKDADLTDYALLGLNSTSASPFAAGGQAYGNDATTFAVTDAFGSFTASSAAGVTYVAYLFASCPGVSKVGSFTGTGATQVINCGFTGGARFVLIKATSTTGNWMVWDSARGIVAANDPYLTLNTTNAEVTNTDWVDTAASGFELSNAGGNLANSNGVSYIYLAIA